jgi:hypothetical protein
MVNLKKYQETIMCYVAGIFVAIGWWLWIDGHVSSAVQGDVVQVRGEFYVIGIVSTIGLIM